MLTAVPCLGHFSQHFRVAFCIHASGPLHIARLIFPLENAKRPPCQSVFFNRLILRPPSSFRSPTSISSACVLDQALVFQTLPLTAATINPSSQISFFPVLSQTAGSQPKITCWDPQASGSFVHSLQDETPFAKYRRWVEAGGIR